MFMSYICSMSAALSEIQGEAHVSILNCNDIAKLIPWFPCKEMLSCLLYLPHIAEPV